MLSILKALLSHSLVAELPIQEQAPWRTANYPIAQLPKECPNDSPDIHKLTCDGTLIRGRQLTWLESTGAPMRSKRCCSARP